MSLAGGGQRFALAGEPDRLPRHRRPLFHTQAQPCRLVARRLRSAQAAPEPDAPAGSAQGKKSTGSDKPDILAPGELEKAQVPQNQDRVVRENFATEAFTGGAVRQTPQGTPGGAAEPPSEPGSAGANSAQGMEAGARSEGAGEPAASPAAEAPKRKSTGRPRKKPGAGLGKADAALADLMAWTQRQVADSGEPPSEQPRPLAHENGRRGRKKRQGAGEPQAAAAASATEAAPPKAPRKYRKRGAKAEEPAAAEPPAAGASQRGTAAAAAEPSAGEAAPAAAAAEPPVGTRRAPLLRPALDGPGEGQGQEEGLRPQQQGAHGQGAVAAGGPLGGGAAELAGEGPERADPEGSLVAASGETPDLEDDSAGGFFEIEMEGANFYLAMDPEGKIDLGNVFVYDTELDLYAEPFIWGPIPAEPRFFLGLPWEEEKASDFLQNKPAEIKVKATYLVEVANREREEVEIGSVYKLDPVAKSVANVPVDWKTDSLDPTMVSLRITPEGASIMRNDQLPDVEDIVQERLLEEEKRKWGVKEEKEPGKEGEGAEASAPAAGRKEPEAEVPEEPSRDTELANQLVEDEEIDLDEPEDTPDIDMAD